MFFCPNPHRQVFLSKSNPQPPPIKIDCCLMRLQCCLESKIADHTDHDHLPKPIGWLDAMLSKDGYRHGF